MTPSTRGRAASSQSPRRNLLLASYVGQRTSGFSSLQHTAIGFPIAGRPTLVGGTQSEFTIPQFSFPLDFAVRAQKNRAEREREREREREGLLMQVDWVPFLGRTFFFSRVVRSCISRQKAPISLWGEIRIAKTAGL